MNKFVASQKRAVHGILLLDKPSGISSNHALQKVKRIFQAKKAGHTGSLDPLASGMLPICLGEATKFSQFLLDSDKNYRVVAQLGIRTTTSDKEGEIVAERPVPKFSLQQIENAFNHFRGETQQIPSMFSALKYQGQPLYKLARQGITVDRPSRPIHIYQLNVIHFENDRIEFEVHCSKGTYIRTLVDDFGELIGCGAHITHLHRLWIGSYRENPMQNFQQLEERQEDLSSLDQYLLPLSTAVSTLSPIQLTDAMAFYLRQGKSISISNALTSGLVSIFTKQGNFLGIAEIKSGQCLIPKRLIASDTKI